MYSPIDFKRCQSVLERVFDFNEVKKDTNYHIEMTVCNKFIYLYLFEGTFAIDKMKYPQGQQGKTLHALTDEFFMRANVAAKGN